MCFFSDLLFIYICRRNIIFFITYQKHTAQYLIILFILTFIPKQEYISGSIIRKKYGVSTASLHRWEGEGKIHCTRTPGGKRLYSKADTEELFDKPIEEKKKTILYARVSSEKQKGDLERQTEQIKQEAKNWDQIITDVGSGLNWKRKGFNALLEQVYNGNVEKVIVAHKDRLCRFAFEIVEWIFEKAGTKLVVLGAERENHTEQQELAEDIIAITTVFVARHNGLRAAENRRRRKAIEAETGIIAEKPVPKERKHKRPSKKNMESKIESEPEAEKSD